MNITQHISLTDQHITPPEVIEAVKATMGGIDLDPCSSEQINNFCVKAPIIFTEDGIENMHRLLSKETAHLKLWCNPPGGKSHNKSNLKIWLKTVILMWRFDYIEQAFFMLFNRKHLGLQCLQKVPRLHFRKRLHYWAYNDRHQKFMPGNWSLKIYHPNEPLITVQNTIAYAEDDDLLFVGKTEAETLQWLQHRQYNYRVWKSRPTHPSTLLYLPPKQKHFPYAAANENFKNLGKWIVPC